MSRSSYELLTTSAGERTAIIRGPVSEQTRLALAGETFSRLVLSHGSGPGLEFLRGRTIDHLLIRSREVNWDWVSSLRSLRALVIEGAYEPRLDFSCMPDLRYLEIYWDKGLGNTLASAKSIVAMRLHKGTDAAWETLRELKKLRALSIVQSRSILSLSYLVGKQVEYAEFIKCQGIGGIGDLSAAANLRCFNLEQCTGMFSAEDLRTSVSIEELLLSIDKIKTLTPLVDTGVRRLRFECSVEDGDIDFLLHMPRLEFCLFKNSRNLSISSTSVQQALTARGFDQQAIRDQLARFPFPSSFA